MIATGLQVLTLGIGTAVVGVCGGIIVHYYQREYAENPLTGRESFTLFARLWTAVGLLITPMLIYNSLVMEQFPKVFTYTKVPLQHLFKTCRRVNLRFDRIF